MTAEDDLFESKEFNDAKVQYNYIVQIIDIMQHSRVAN